MPSGTPSIPLTELGVRLRDLRERTGMTQWDLARALGTKANRVSDWELGKYEPSLPTLKKYGEVIGMTVSGILRTVM